jgi:hypothetical protein
VPFALRTYACGVCAILMLAACDGTPVAPRSSPATSWMRGEAKSEDLIYATGGCLGTCVFSYPSGDYVGTLGVGGDDGGDCTDSSGNAYIADDGQIFEYAHGAENPTATFEVTGSNATGCSVDPTTGNLAVVFVGSADNLAVFSQGSSEPVLYNAGIDAAYCGYNQKGDLFVDGFGSANVPALVELRSGSGGFVHIALKRALGLPGQIQWDGTYVTYEGLTKQNITISRLDIDGSSATVVGTTFFYIKAPASQSWIYAGNVLIPYGNLGSRGQQNHVGVFDYPSGGKPEHRIQAPRSYVNSVNFRGVALSLAAGSR